MTRTARGKKSLFSGVKWWRQIERMLNWMEQTETLQPWVSSGVRCWQDVFVLRWGGRCWEMAEGVRVGRETTTMTMLVGRRREDCSARVDGLKRPRGKCQQNNHYENCNCSSDFTLSCSFTRINTWIFTLRCSTARNSIQHEWPRALEQMKKKRKFVIFWMFHNLQFINRLINPRLFLTFTETLLSLLRSSTQHTTFFFFLSHSLSLFVFFFFSSALHSQNFPSIWIIFLSFSRLCFCFTSTRWGGARL